jgi:hypothetical protein
MHLYRFVPMIAFGLFLPAMALSQDLLTPAVTADLTKECLDLSGYQSCVAALSFHGSGNDDEAMKAIIRLAPDEAAKQHYQIAQAMPSDGFWTLVATAGATKVNCSGNGDLSKTLKEHFKLSSKSLSDADDDSAKNKFLALSDLLAVPSGTALSDWMANANVYRYCFGVANLFPAVKKSLGR